MTLFDAKLTLFYACQELAPLPGKEGKRVTEARRQIRILIADDQRSFRDALRCLLPAEEGLCFAGEADSGFAAIESAQRPWRTTSRC